MPKLVNHLCWTDNKDKISFILSFIKMHQRALLFSALAVAANAQQVGTQKAENHPALTWQKCTAAGSCTQQSGSVVIDANWRWLHSTKDTTNCYTGNTVGISTGSRI